MNRLRLAKLIFLGLILIIVGLVVGLPAILYLVSEPANPASRFGTVVFGTFAGYGLMFSVGMMFSTMSEGSLMQTYNWIKLQFYYPTRWDGFAVTCLSVKQSKSYRSYDDILETLAKMRTEPYTGVYSFFISIVYGDMIDIVSTHITMTRLDDTDYVSSRYVAQSLKTLKVDCMRKYPGMFGNYASDEETTN